MDFNLNRSTINMDNSCLYCTVDCLLQASFKFEIIECVKNNYMFYSAESCMAAQVWLTAKRKSEKSPYTTDTHYFRWTFPIVTHQRTITLIVIEQSNYIHLKWDRLDHIDGFVEEIYNKETPQIYALVDRFNRMLGFLFNFDSRSRILDQI